MEHPEDWRAWQVFLDCALPLPGTSTALQQVPPILLRASNLSFLPENPAKPLQGCWQSSQIHVRYQLHCDRPSPQAPSAAQTAVTAAEELLREAGAGSAKASKSAKRGLALARAELEVRRQSLTCGEGSPSASGEEGQGLAEALLGCFSELGHTMSCPRDLRFDSLLPLELFASKQTRLGERIVAFHGSSAAGFQSCLMQADTSSPQ